MKNDEAQNSWLQLVITTPTVLVDSVTDFVVGIVGAAVEVSVEDVVEKRVVNGYLERKNLNEAEILLVKNQVQTHLQELADIFGVEIPELSVTTIHDEDWGSNWKKHFKPFHVIPGLTITPTWEEYSPKPGESIIEMDPGMAFGTGHHPTTAMSTALIKDAVDSIKDATVMDVGTGTGVLGMAALLLGAKQVYGVDNDIEAVMAAKDNVAHNGLSEKMEVSQEDISEIHGTYNLVVANIVHDVLQMLRVDLMRLVSPNCGQLVLSGLIAGDQVKSIIATFTESGQLAVAEAKVDGEWAAIRFVTSG